MSSRYQFILGGYALWLAVMVLVTLGFHLFREGFYTTEWWLLATTAVLGIGFLINGIVLVMPLVKETRKESMGEIHGNR